MPNVRLIPTTLLAGALAILFVNTTLYAAQKAARFENGPAAHEVKTKLRNADGANASGATLAPLRIAPALSVRTAAVQTAGTGANLIQNPGFETAGTSGLPANWLKGGYGANARSLTYPVSGNGGTKAAQISITSYTSGDAKWYFATIPITGGGTYLFSDYSKSNVPTIVDVQYTMKDGSLAYADIANVPASSSFQKTSAQFTAPANAVSVQIYHLINRVGTLAVDDYSLQDISAAPPPDNLVPNGTLESGTSAPTNWKSSSWGSNAATFDYPVASVDGSKAAKVTIANYSSGDAKWYFLPIVLSPGVYTFSDQYSSAIASTITLQLQNADGSYSYKDIAALPASSGFNSASADFTVPSGTKNVTAFHLIKQNGSLTIDNVSITQKSVLSGIFSTGAVTLRFDDAWLSQYKNALPKLVSAGMRGTFYIVTQQLSDNGFPAYMSKSQVQTLYAKGMEIGAHTRTHPDLSTLSAGDQQSEIQGSRQDLLGWNVGPISSFAYPFGSYTATSIQIAKNAGFSSAAATITGDVTPTSDPYQLEHHEITSSTSLATVQGWIDEALSKKLWLILTIHEVNTTCGTYCVSPTEFGQIVDYLKTKNAPVVTVSEGMQSLH